mgnify:CR=1 FL=1
MRKPQIGERIVVKKCLASHANNCNKLQGESCLGAVVEVAKIEDSLSAFVNSTFSFGIKFLGNNNGANCYVNMIQDEYIFFGGEKEEIE